MRAPEPSPIRAEAADRPNVLITSAARKVPLVQAFRRATTALGGRVIAADVQPLAAALYEADVARLVPRSDDPVFIDALLELCATERIGLVVPTRDEELPVLAAARDAFAAAGTLVLVSSADAVETCQDKRRFGDAVRRAGLATPRTFENPAAAELPAFIKPRRGKGAAGARIVADRANLAAALAELGEDAIVQEVVHAPEFTVDAFFDLDGRAITCVPRERVAVVAGESVISRTVVDPDLAVAAIRLAGAIGLIGHVTIQAFRTPDAILFIEINPRYGGAANLGFEAGSRTPELAIRLARGETLEPELDAYEPGLVMLRSASDRFIRAGEVIGASTRISRGPRAVLFDLDDTLYPERQFVDGGFRAAARTLRAALAPAAERGEEELVDRLWQLHSEAGRGRLFDRLIEELTSAPADPGLVLACLHAYRTHEPRLVAVPGIERLLGDLERRGVPLGLVSDGLASVQRRKLDAMPSIRGRFGAIVMTDELGPGHAKPAPDGFLLACRLLGVAPADATYVANDDRKDFRGARAAGLATIRFGPQPDEGGRATGQGVDRHVDPADDSDHRADTVDELARLLAPLPAAPVAGLTE